MLRRNAVSAPTAAAAVLVILLVGGAGIYLALKGSTASSSSSDNGLTTQASSSSLAMTSSTSSISAPSCVETPTNQTVAYVSPLPLLEAYNSQTVSFSQNTSSFLSATESFQVDYRSQTTIKVSTDFDSTATNSTHIEYTSWWLRNGTVTAVYVSTGDGGVNETGTQALAFVTGAFAGYFAEVQFAGYQSELASSPQIFNSETSTVALSGQQFQVTNFTLEAPGAATLCGATFEMQSLSMSIGSPPGASLPIVVSLQFNGDLLGGIFPMPEMVTLETLAFSPAS